MVATSNFRRQKGAMKQALYWGSTGTGRHRTKFRRPSLLAPGICTHLPLIHLPFVGWGQWNHHDGNKLYLFPRGIFLQLCTFYVTFIKESCYFGDMTDSQVPRVEKPRITWMNLLAFRKIMTAFRASRFNIIFSCSMEVGLLTLCKACNEYIPREK